jgi:hypothetical protein
MREIVLLFIIAFLWLSIIASLCILTIFIIQFFFGTKVAIADSPLLKLGWLD